MSLKDKLADRGIYYFSLGNTCTALLNRISTARDDSNLERSSRRFSDATGSITSTNAFLGPDYLAHLEDSTNFFYGRISLPFFFKGISDFKKWIV